MAAHIPSRTCVGCRCVDTPAQMIRVVRQGDSQPAQLVVDLVGHAHGRGAWVHARTACISAALNRGGFARSFKGPIHTAGLAESLEAAALTRGTEPLLEAG